MLKFHNKILTIFTLSFISLVPVTYAADRDITKIFKRSSAYAKTTKGFIAIAKEQLFNNIKALEKDIEVIFASDYFKNNIDPKNPKVVIQNLIKEEQDLAHIYIKAEDLAKQHNLKLAHAAALLILTGKGVDFSLILENKK